MLPRYLLNLKDVPMFYTLPLNRPKRIRGTDESEIYCFLSPSARYGVYLTRAQAPDFRPLETHFYNYHFTVCDFILDTANEYISTCSPFKRFHRFYFLNDSIGVLVDFSRNLGAVTQNIIRFSHENCSVTCEYARIWNFSVDDMLHETDNTRLIATTALMQYGDIAYLPLLGEKDHMPEIYARLVPANPFQQCCSGAPLITINEEDAYRRAVRIGDQEFLRLPDLCTDRKCYPLISGTSLYFVVQFRPRDLEAYAHTCAAMLRIDFKNYFETNFSTMAQINTIIRPLFWSIPTETFYIRPRFIKVMAQNGPLAVFRALIFGPQRTWILVNLDTMTLNPLGIDSTVRHNCAMLDKNRLILQRNNQFEIVNYNAIWVYHSIPRLKHLTFWKVISTLKNLRVKKCHHFGRISDNTCTACWTLDFVMKLLPSCCDP